MTTNTINLSAKRAWGARYSSYRYERWLTRLFGSEQFDADFFFEEWLALFGAGVYRGARFYQVHVSITRREAGYYLYLLRVKRGQVVVAAVRDTVDDLPF